MLRGAPYISATALAGTPLAANAMPGPLPMPISALPAVSNCCSLASPVEADASMSRPYLAKMPDCTPISSGVKVQANGTTLATRSFSAAFAGASLADSGSVAPYARPAIRLLRDNRLIALSPSLCVLPAGSRKGLQKSAPIAMRQAFHFRRARVLASRYGSIAMKVPATSGSSFGGLWPALALFLLRRSLDRLPIELFGQRQRFVLGNSVVRNAEHRAWADGDQDRARLLLNVVGLGDRQAVDRRRDDVPVTGLVVHRCLSRPQHAQGGRPQYDRGVKLRRVAPVIARGGGHAGGAHFHRHAVRFLALPAVKVDEQRKK